MDVTEFPITIRPAYPDDRAALQRLAGLDSATVPDGPLLVAEIDGQLRVAVSTVDLRAIADPFFLTASVVELIKQHIERAEARTSRRRRLLGRLTPALHPHVA
jgi:hypothetical protein